MDRRGRRIRRQARRTRRRRGGVRHGNRGGGVHAAGVVRPRDHRGCALSQRRARGSRDAAVDHGCARRERYDPAMSAAAATPTIPAEKLPELLELVEGADSVELKLTVPMSDRAPAGQALGVDPLEAQIRQVYFFDTPDLALYKNGLVARARRVQKKGDDSVIKLRPVVPAELSGALRASENFFAEVAALPGGDVC